MDLRLETMHDDRPRATFDGHRDLAHPYVRGLPGWVWRSALSRRRQHHDAADSDVSRLAI
jgi:hypothetical protein